MSRQTGKRATEENTNWRDRLGHGSLRLAAAPRQGHGSLPGGTDSVTDLNGMTWPEDAQVTKTPGPVGFSGALTACGAGGVSNPLELVPF